MPSILHCIDTTGPGGAETLFVELAGHFSRPPYTSCALLRGHGWVERQLRANGTPVIIEESRGSVNIRYLLRLIKHIRRNRIDLVHAHLPGANLYGSLAGWIAGIPAISTWHGTVDLRSSGRLEALRKRIIRHGSRVVAVSTGLREEVATRLGMPIDQIELIPNGIDFERFAHAQPLGLRKQFGLAPDARVIGSLGNIRPAKAYDVGLRVLRRLRDQGTDAWWFVAGQARQGDALLGTLEAQAVELGVDDRVRFLGFVEKPERFLADIDAFLLCSSSEGHPLALTQAMAAGLPIVATRCGVEPVLGDGLHGWLAGVDDAPGLSDHLQVVLAGGEAVTRKRRGAATFARNTYDRIVVMQRYEKLYTELLTRRGR
jgi:glycosyltransferase involved in cell wall biosynthesis